MAQTETFQPKPRIELGRRVKSSIVSTLDIVDTTLSRGSETIDLTLSIVNNNLKELAVDSNIDCLSTQLEGVQRLVALGMKEPDAKQKVGL